MKNLKLILATIIIIGVNSCSIVEVIPSVVSFAKTTDSGLEGTNYAIGIELDLPVDADITINYTVSGTANSFSDFSLPSSVTVPSGSSSAVLDLQVFDNTDYDKIGKTVIVTITDFSGSDNITLGTNLTFTYTILENDLEIVLSWQPNFGIPEDHDVDLFLVRADNLFTESSSTCGSCITEEIVITQNNDNIGYYVIVNYFSGAITNSALSYTINLSLPNGNESTKSDMFTDTNTSNRTFYLITKNADGDFSVTEDPFGPNGRHEPFGPLVKN